MQDSKTSSGAHIGGTVLAFFITPIVLSLVAIVVGFLWAFLNTATTVVRPGIIGFFAAITGGVAGTYAARISCDSVLKSYAKRAVFVEIALLVLGLLFFEYMLPLSWDRLAPVAQILAVAATGWTLFWKDEDI